MRAIKFRAWNKQECKMIYPEEATIGKNLLAIGLHGLPIAVDQDSFKEDQSDEIIGWNVDHVIDLMQFIGRKDKNGKDICEDDIVKYLDNTSQGLTEKIVVIRDIRHLPDFLCSQWEEIIGNIYETPELLPQNED